MTKSAIKTLLNGIKAIIPESYDFDISKIFIDSSKVIFDDSLKETYNGAKNAKEGFEELNKAVQEINSKLAMNEGQDYVLLKDASDGYTYIVQMNNGNLTSRCRCIDIQIKQPPKLSYYTNEVFDPTGMIIEAVLKDGSCIEINNYTYNNPILNGSPHVILKIDYVECGETFSTSLVLSIKSRPGVYDLSNITETLTLSDRSVIYRVSEEEIAPERLDNCVIQFEDTSIAGNHMFFDRSAASDTGNGYIFYNNQGQELFYISYGDLCIDGDVYLDTGVWLRHIWGKDNPAAFCFVDPVCTSCGNTYVGDVCPTCGV